MNWETIKERVLTSLDKMKFANWSIFYATQAKKFPKEIDTDDKYL